MTYIQTWTWTNWAGSSTLRQERDDLHSNLDPDKLGREWELALRLRSDPIRDVELRHRSAAISLMLRAATSVPCARKNWTLHWTQLSWHLDLGYCIALACTQEHWMLHFTFLTHQVGLSCGFPHEPFKCDTALSWADRKLEVKWGTFKHTKSAPWDYTSLTYVQESAYLIYTWCGIHHRQALTTPALLCFLPQTELVLRDLHGPDTWQQV